MSSDAQLAYEYEERAGIIEHLGKLPRAEAERLARLEVYGTKQKELSWEDMR